MEINLSWKDKKNTHTDVIAQDDDLVILITYDYPRPKKDKKKNEQVNHDAV